MDEWVNVMTNKILEYLKQLFKPNSYEPNIDLAQFDDEVAYLTSFKPISNGAANFTTHRLRQDSKGNYLYCPTILARLIGLPFIGFGITDIVLNDNELPLLIFGMIFLVCGGFIMYQTSLKTVFNDAQRTFYSGYFSNPANSIGYEKIHALQIIAKQVNVNGDGDTPPSSFIAYELNLVDHQGNRKHIHCYSSEKAVLADGATLSQYLKVPQWLAI